VIYSFVFLWSCGKKRWYRHLRGSLATLLVVIKRWLNIAH